MQIRNRNKELVEFDRKKIVKAIEKAMISCGSINKELKSIANSISIAIEEDIKSINGIVDIRFIEEQVFIYLTGYGLKNVARSYESYRAIRQYKRETNTIDKSIAELLSLQNEDLKKENANKNVTILSTGRDYVAGELSKDYMRRIALPTHITYAHESGAIHYHDLDYAMQPMINCCLIPIGEMLSKGTVMNNRLYETPQTFEKACGIVAQIIAQVSSNQYGGNSVNVKHLGEYLYKSEIRLYKDEISALRHYRVKINKHKVKERVDKKLKEVCRAGIRSLLWQINGFSTLSGQSPFTTLFMEIEPDSKYEKYQAMVAEEIIEQRYRGMKNEKGVHVSPAFPKLIFVLDENNVHPNSKYYYIKKKAVKCSAKRLVPDYISAKKMKELYEGNVFSPMGCRSKLSVWYDEDGKPKFEGRFNMGVVSLNLPQIAILSEGDMDRFWKILEGRLKVCKDALMFRYEWLKDTPSDVSPIHWQHGVLGRLKKGEPINKLLENGYATISLGYIGIYEMTKIMKGVSHTDEEGKKFAIEVMKKLKDTVDLWREETGLGFGLYGTPSEGLCNRFCQIDKKQFGTIKDVTDKGWYTNSFHVDVREEIDAFTKLKFESEFQKYSSGGFISYIEVANMEKNLDALEQVIDYGYENTVYFEINTKSDFCYECGFTGEMKLDEITWYCPNCGNKDFDKLHVVRRTCGYIGENGFNEGKTREIAQRVLHI